MGGAGGGVVLVSRTRISSEEEEEEEEEEDEDDDDDDEEEEEDESSSDRFDFFLDVFLLFDFRVPPSSLLPCCKAVMAACKALSSKVPPFRVLISFSKALVQAKP